ncbi:unnamed protein product [Linum tenue]|uniref:Uncharacterized protein n=1 Tax=Linum tenue TaxID=586396 RepID=A0AAV0HMJ9_9ROSI|nr:unnamed protein product [Linum tenue]CAI0386109.1 unnamed protein product [Linum tenue]
MRRRHLRLRGVPERVQGRGHPQSPPQLCPRLPLALHRPLDAEQCHLPALPDKHFLGATRFGA